MDVSDGVLKFSGRVNCKYKSLKAFASLKLKCHGKLRCVCACFCFLLFYFPPFLRNAIKFIYLNWCLYAAFCARSS